MNNKMVKDYFFPYTWHIDDKEREITIIRIYGLDKKNRSVCVKIPDFLVYLYLELPEKTEEGTSINWRNNLYVNLISSKIDQAVGNEFTPIEKYFELKQRLYYANMSNDKHRKFPFFMCKFSSEDDKKGFMYKIRRPIKTDIGTIRFRIHEQNIEPIFQFICKKDISTAGWIKFGGEKIKNKETLCDKEYVVSWRDVTRADDIEFVPKPIVMSMDIEVNSSNVNMMPKASNPKDKIFQISAVLHCTGKDKFDKYLLSLGDPDQEETGNEVTILRFKTEDDLLVGYSKFIREKSPQIIIGYNIFGFDFGYMTDRAKDCIYDFDQQGYRKGVHSPDKKSSWSSSAYKNQDFRYLDAEGRLFIDLLPVVRRDYKLNNYKLKTVAEHFLKNDLKDDLSVKGIFRCYRIGMKGGEKGAKALGRVGKYCVQDSLVVSRLFEVLQIWFGLTEMAKTCRVPIIYLYIKGQQIKVFSQIYKKCMDEDIVITSSDYKTSGIEKYEGATVVTPKWGVYDRVVPYDFTSLYPTTIIAYNIDYTTLVTDDSIPDSECNIIEWKDEEDNKIEYRYRFLKSPIGIVPSILKNLLDARNNTKSEIKELKKIEQTEEVKTKLIVLNKRQLSYKVSANSAYGAMGVKKGYIPFMPGAMCTTAQGRKSIRKAGNVLQEYFGAELIYGDTDSCYVHFPHIDTANKLWEHCLKIEKEMDDMGLFPKPMKLLFEQVIYWRFLIIKKKLYMALECDGSGVVSDKIMKKGVILARRDNSAFVRRVYENVTMRIFNRANQEEVLGYIHTELENMKELSIDNYVISKSIGAVEDYKVRELPKDPKKLEKRLSDLELPMQLDKNGKLLNDIYKTYIIRSLPGHIQFAEKLRGRGIRVDAGQRLEYVISDTNSHKDKMYKKLEDPEYLKKHSDVLKIDYLYYIKNLSKPLDQVLEIAYGLKDYMAKDIYKTKLKEYKDMTSYSELKFVE